MTTQDQIDALVEQAAAQALQNLQHEAEHADLLQQITMIRGELKELHQKNAEWAKRFELLENHLIPLSRTRQQGELIGAHEVPRVGGAAKTAKLGLMEEEKKHDRI